MNERSGRSARLAVWLALAGFAAAGAHYALTKSMHQDVAYYVNAVERWLGGARLYRDMIDVNVPTIYWVMAAPVWIAQRLGLPSTLVFNLFALALAALSTAAVWRLAARALPRESFVPDAAAGALLIWCAALVGHDFGQREHLATMLLAPYAIARAAGREVGSGVRILIGLCAGIGLALKPHFAFIVLGMEGALLLRRGRAWRPSVETAALAVSAGACAAATILLVPDYMDRILPLARATYQGFEWPLASLIGAQGPRTFGSFALALLAVPLAWAIDRRAGDVAAVLAGGALGGFASFLVQSKGWLYQLTPALTYATAAFAVAAAALAGRWISHRRERWPALALAIACVGVLAAALTLELDRLSRSDAALQQRQAPVVETVRRYAGGGGPALFISIEVDYTFPAVNYAGASYPYRWHHLLPMPGLYKGFEPGPDGRFFRAPEQMGPLEREFFDSFVEDAVAHPPRLVMVDRRRLVRPGLAPELDLLAYFCQSPPFAKLLAAYDWLGRRGSYDVLVPRPAGSAAAGACATPAPNPNGEPSS